MATNIEKQNLEAHVELCAERYSALEAKFGTLESKLSALESKVENLEEHIIFIREKLSGTPNQANKTLITIGTTIIGVLISAIILLLVNFVNK